MEYIKLLAASSYAIKFQIFFLPKCLLCECSFIQIGQHINSKSHERARHLATETCGKATTQRWGKKFHNQKKDECCVFWSDIKLEIGFTLPFSHARGAFLITFPFGTLPMTSFPLAISAPITTEYATTLRRSRADKHSHTLVARFEWELCQFTSQTSHLKCYQRHIYKRTDLQDWEPSAIFLAYCLSAINSVCTNQ